jgi:hypothetical protein
VVVVNWNSSIYSVVAANEAQFATDITTGPYVNLLNSWGVSSGSYAGTYNLNYSALSTIDQVDLESDLSVGMFKNLIPNFTKDGINWDGSTMYMVYLPPNMQVTLKGQSVCAYHGQFCNYLYPNNPSSCAPFAVMPDFAPGSVCANGYDYTVPFGQATKTFFVSSHEFIEAAVDPFGGNPEVGDPCDSGAGLHWTPAPGANHSWLFQQPMTCDSHGNNCVCRTLSQPSPITPSAANSDAFAVARQPGNLDAFFTLSNGQIIDDFWNSSGWGYTAVTNPNAGVAGAPIVATARTGNNLDAFWFGTDGALYDAFWSAGNSWGTARVTSGSNGPSRSNLAAVSRTANNLDVFWIGFDGNLWTAFWNPTSSWGTTRVTSDGNAATGGGVAAVARTANNIDVFWINKNGAMETAYWSSGNSWGTLVTTSNGVGTSGSSVAAASRDWSRLDVFWVNPSGNVQQARWFDLAQANPNWLQTAVSPAVAYSSSAQISAVTREPSNLDLFLVGTDGAVYNPYFTDASGWGQARAAAVGTAISGSAIAGTTRTPSNLDAFEVGANGTTHYSEFWSAGNNWGTSVVP